MRDMRTALETFFNRYMSEIMQAALDDDGKGIRRIQDLFNLEFPNCDLSVDESKNEFVIVDMLPDGDGMEYRIGVK